MLTHLSIKNFAIVKNLDIEFKSNMTAITGETGAGKSIAIDALGLCLGTRAEATMVRKNTQKAEITATFQISENHLVKSWLQQNDLEDMDDICLVRRVVSAEGRSRAYVNGNPVPLQQIKELGQWLVVVHGQHAHQALLKSGQQRHLLDQFAAHNVLLDQTKSLSSQYSQLQNQLSTLQGEQQQRNDRKQLLSYQLSELDEFDLGDQEFQTLEAEFKKQSHSQTILEDAQLSFHELYESEQGNALQLVRHAIDKLDTLQEHDPLLSPIVSMLNEAGIQIEEAASELRGYIEDIEIDPLKMQRIEERYSKALDLARKHSCNPEELFEVHQTLHEENSKLCKQENDLTEFQEQLENVVEEYRVVAEKLSVSRQKAAIKLSQKVEQTLHNLNMPDAVFEIRVEPLVSKSINLNGLDDIGFYLASNKGIDPETIDKAASGGELSRIGLALQVLTNSVQSATLIFDEVDVGISGATAAIVGKMLRSLGENNQVMCVTHLPQVAAAAQNQMLVTKYSDKETTETHMQILNDEARVEEVARLLAGDRLTNVALENAQSLLSGS